MTHRIFYYLVCIGLLAGNVRMCAQHDHLSHLGLIGELAYHKSQAENHALRIFNHQLLPDSVKSEMVTRYNSLRVAYETIILQLVSDIHTKSRWYYIKNLDKYFYKGKIKNREKVKYFVENWAQVIKIYDHVMSYPNKPYLDKLQIEYLNLQTDKVELIDKKQEAMSGVKLNPLDPVGSATSVFSIYKIIGLRNDMRVGNVTVMLNAVRLRHAAELVADYNEPMKIKMIDGENGNAGK